MFLRRWGYGWDFLMLAWWFFCWGGFLFAGMASFLLGWFVCLLGWLLICWLLVFFAGATYSLLGLLFYQSSSTAKLQKNCFTRPSLKSKIKKICFARPPSKTKNETQGSTHWGAQGSSLEAQKHRYLFLFIGKLRIMRLEVKGNTLWEANWSTLKMPFICPGKTTNFKAGSRREGG